MGVTRVVLKNGSSEVILQGMSHIAPATFYQHVQQEMNDVTAKGYKVLFEGVMDGTAEEMAALSDQEKKAAQVLERLTDLYPVIADMDGNKTQREVKYPDDAVRADLNSDKIAQMVVAAGFKSELILGILDRVPKESIHTPGMAQAKQKKRSWWYRPFFAIGYFIGNIFGRAVAWYLFSPVKEVLVDRRDEVCVQTLEAQGGRNVLIHYGEGHVPGIVKLLKKSGWQVVDKTIIDMPDL